MKLFEVCRLRDIPIITFVNKVDREGRDPFELLDEVQEKLALDIAPMVWPIGMGTALPAAIDLGTDDRFLHQQRRLWRALRSDAGCHAMDSTTRQLASRVPESVLEPAKENIELARGAYPAFDQKVPISRAI